MTFIRPAKSALAHMALSLALALWPADAFAHAGEQGFVLLLPTRAYIWSGAAAVALTAILLLVLPYDAAARLFRPVKFWQAPARPGPVPISTMSAILLGLLVWIGINGPHDPVENLLPLSIWTLFWAGLVLLQAIFGNIWRWINPFSGPHALYCRLTGWKPPFRLPPALGYWPGIAAFVAFAAFYMADIAPSDPHRLAMAVLAYWLATLLGMILFGPRPWRMRAEFITILMGNYARLAPLARRGQRLALGLPGHAALRRPVFSAAVFMVAMLASGSFDGLNETFWWLGLIGVNPLEFPGRSAVIPETLAGLLVANVALIGAFAAAVWAGLKLAGATVRLREAFSAFAPSLLPIALAYHFGHYLTLLMVNGQHFLAALTDPFDSGADWLGLGDFHVTTGFFNTLATVRVIWLSQAGMVVGGHVLAILMAHAIAEKLYGGKKAALLSQLPLAAFMIAYTWFGLWLLASPRGA